VSVAEPLICFKVIFKGLVHTNMKILSLKGVHPKMKISPWFTHPQAIL